MQNERNILRRFHNIACLVLLVFFVTGCSYTKELTILSRKEAIYDLDYLVKNLKAIHPAPFTCISEEEFDTYVQQTKDELGDKTSRKDLSLLVAESLALIRDEHTSLWGFARSWAFQGSELKILPLRLRYESSGVVVKDYAKTVKPKNLKKGDIVIAINDMPTKSLLKQYRKYISAETELQQNWEVVARLPYLLWLIEGEHEFFELAVMGTDGESFKETLPAGLPPTGGSGNVEFPFEFYFDDEVCLLKAPSFWYTLAEKWEKYLKKLFSEMKVKRTSILIVDLRGNGGGHGGLGQLLIRKTANRPFKTATKKWRYSKAYQRACLIYGLKQRRVPAWLHLENILKLHNYPPYRDLVDVSKLKGEWLIPSEGGLEKPDSTWNGTLVLLCDRFTGSAAVDTATIVKDNALGLIIGEETGGRASYFSEVAPVYLPNSGILCKMSSAHFLRPAGFDDGRGVLPDLSLDVTLDDDILVEKIHNYLKTNLEK